MTVGCNYLWCDRRTGLVLAEGAKQNWPTRADDDYIVKLKREAGKDAEEQRLRMQAARALAASLKTCVHFEDTGPSALIGA